VRIVIIGTGGLAATTARLLLRRGHEVVIIERDKGAIDALSDELDVGFVHGDGTKPAILKQVEPKRCDLLLCLTGDDQSNILGSLVGRHLGFPRVVTKIEDREFEHICLELGLEDTVIPDATIARYLVDVVAGHNVPELLAVIKGDVRFFSFVARKEDEKKIGEVGLPDRTRLIGVSRADKFLIAEEGTRLQEGDEVLLVTHTDNLEALRDEWSPKP
jgi:trk system potassium uptake protein TrkA